MPRGSTADNARPAAGAAMSSCSTGRDNFDTRRVVADACEALRLPLVFGAVSMFDGQVTVFAPGGPQFSDLYPVTPDEADLPSCEVVGVLGAGDGRDRHADGDGSDQADHRRGRGAGGAAAAV